MRRMVFFIVFIGVIGLFFAWSSLKPVDSSDDRAKLARISSGQSVDAIATSLEQLGLIRSKAAFKAYVKWKGLASKLKAGSFSLKPSQSVSEIATILAEGKTGQVSITIPEGYTIAQIDKLLADKGLGFPGDVIKCAFTCDFSNVPFLPKRGGGTVSAGVGSRIEGYIFPDTYFVDPSTYAPESFLKRAMDQFEQRVLSLYKKEGSPRSFSDLVIMASLVEEESRHSEERPFVAGILWKRLDAGTGLGVDATVRYVLGKSTAALTNADLDVDSPYNTRKYRGLPPTPIANPGHDAFEAALKPASSEYWYYLHGKDGQIHYAKTNDEHNANKGEYLR